MLREWTGWVAAVIATMFAIRGSIRFDINQWLKDRREQQEENLKQLCLHSYLDQEDGKIVLRSSFISPFGTTAYQCQLCGQITYDEDAVRHVARYWAENPVELEQRVRQINKLAKKLGRL